MDAGEYDTNTLLINNLTAISYRIYEPHASSSAYTFNASFVVESLRNDGHLVYMDPVRRAIWCFYLTTKKDAATPNLADEVGLPARKVVGEYTIGLAEEGSLEPISLLKTRPLGGNAINTPSSSSSTGSAMEMTVRGAQPFALPSAGVGTAGLHAIDSRPVPSPMAEPRGLSPPSVKEIHDHFITAVLWSLTTFFCRQVGAIALNPRVVLLPKEALCAEDESEVDPAPPTSALATFRVYLTTTGSLVMSIWVSMLHNLVSTADVLRSGWLSVGPDIVAAPFGAFGWLQSVVEADGHPGDYASFGQSPDTQISRLRPELSDRAPSPKWKDICSKYLEMRGMSPTLLNGCSWLNVHFLSKKPQEQRTDGRRTPIGAAAVIAPWPSVLCFRKAKADTHPYDSVEKTWQTATVDRPDPLNSAMAWHQATHERDDLLERRKEEREAALTPHDKNEGDTGGMMANGHSPQDPRPLGANGVAAAAGAMYPTPPDGQPLGMTFDGSVLSPANQVTAAPGDSGAIIQHDIAMQDSFGPGWESGDTKPSQSGGAFSDGDIFGDLGDDIFDGNELTDADFSFFDEVPTPMGLDLPSLPDLDSALEMTASLTRAEASAGKGAVAQTAAGAATSALPSSALLETKPNDTRPVSPQFTKPQLKHARSTLGEETRQLSNIESSNSNAGVGIKRQPSPFNPETVYKRIRASLQPPPLPAKNARRSLALRRSSVFDTIEFNPDLSRVSKKYQESGPFNYTLPSPKDKDVRWYANGSPLTTMGSLLGSARQRRNIKEPPYNSLGALLAKLSSNGIGQDNNSPARRDDLLSDSDDDSNWASDQDDASEGTGNPSSPAKSSVLRRRPDDDLISMAASFKDLENMPANSPAQGINLLTTLDTLEVPSLPLSRYFADPEPVPVCVSVSDDDFITVAQVLTEQAATGLLKLAPPRPDCEAERVRRNLVNAIRFSLQHMQKALPRLLDVATETQMRPLIELQDVPVIAPPSGRGGVPPRPPGLDAPRSPIFVIPPPHIELKRYETQLSVLPSAVGFWESLGLGPARGAKDVLAACVFPQSEGMRDYAASFLEKVRSAYESLRLGTFERLSAGPNLVEGLVSVSADAAEIVSPGQLTAAAGGMGPASTSTPMSRGGGGSRTMLTDCMANLAQGLAGCTATEKNFVVYFCYSPERPSSIVDACTAFQELFEHYKRCMAERKRPIRIDLVLQLVSLDCIALETASTAMSPAEMLRLCFETYDRCTLFGGPMPAPVMVLEKSLVRNIDFKLSAAPSPNVLSEGSCLHVAYAQSADERWVAAAWTDNWGAQQTTAAYCLGRRGKPLATTLGEVIQEIWETTMEMVATLKVHWRVIVTKCGPMEPGEMEIWTTAAAASAASASAAAVGGSGSSAGEPRALVNLTLVTVDTNPSLQLVPPVTRIPVATAQMFYSTPVSTPQTVTSPDNAPGTPGGSGANNPGTPGGSAAAGDGATAPEQDADTTLVDVTETTWGVFVQHRLNNSTSLTELNPALTSGYLVKRGGHRLEDMPVAMEVNIVHTEGTPRIYDHLLKDLLTVFRGLGTLARARGVVEREGDVRPWHVAAVEKAVRVLAQLM